MGEAGRPVQLPVTIRIADVLHCLGYPEGHLPSDRTRRYVQELMGEARGLIEPRGAYQDLPLSESRDVGLEPIPANGLVIGIVTVGHRIEERVTELAAAEQSTAALILDAMGSAAVEEAADRLGVLITDRARPSGSPAESTAYENEPPPALSCRISPGYGQWRLDSQVSLFDRLPHDDVGVKLLPSLLMVPRKSITFAMWLGSDARPVAGLSGCARCGLDHCRYRRAPREEGSNP